MTEVFLTVFYTFSTSMPLRLLSYYPFRGCLRVSKKTAALLIGGSELIALIGVWLAVENGKNPRPYEFLLLFFCIGIYLFNINVQPFKLLFTYWFMTDYLMIIRGVSAFLVVRYFGLSVYSLQGSVLCLILLGVSLPFMFHFFNLTAERIYHTDAPALWRTIWLVPALTSVVVLLFTGAFTEETISRWDFLFARVSLLISVFVVYYVLLRSLDGIRRQAALEEQARQTEQILQLQRSQYAMLQEHIEETRRARHDLRQHLQMIQSYLENGDRQALQEYIDAYGKSLPPDTVKRYCKNYAVDTILRYYIEQLSAAEIDVELNITLPEKLPVAEPDLCVLFGNLLENALETCNGQGEDAYVRIAAQMTGEKSITLIVDNTAPAPPKEQDGAFLSTKHEGFGVGTQSIRRIAARYHGQTDFRWEDGMFYASVFLNPVGE